MFFLWRINIYNIFNQHITVPAVPAVFSFQFRAAMRPHPDVDGICHHLGIDSEDSTEKATDGSFVTEITINDLGNYH